MKRILLMLVFAGIVLASSFSAGASRAQTQRALYLPMIGYRSPTFSPFGLQSHTPADAALLNAASQLKVGGVRYGFLSWRDVQPTAGSPYNWAAVADFDATVRLLRQNGLEPLIYVGRSPDWATIHRADGVATSCAAVRDSAIDDFAAFMAAAAARYSQPEFGVRYWELGNEVDVDPNLVAVDNGFGCWGDIGDPYYGGERYGRMLQAVTPAIKAANPQAMVIFGGLLLDNPNTTAANRGKPERFFEGALRGAGGAPFDILAYHSYPPYIDRAIVGQIDFDAASPGNPWRALGGNVHGKAQFLRDVMARYNLSRPLWLNETSLMCPDDSASTFTWCRPLVADFDDAQANYLVRTMARARAEGIEHIDWYSLETVWRYTGLLDKQLAPKPAFSAYQQLIARLGEAVPLGAVSYGTQIEGYRFRNNGVEVQVVWAIKGNTTQTIDLPIGTLVTAYSRDGTQLFPESNPGTVRYSVGFSPIYLVFG